MSNKKAAYIAAIDIGGTNIVAAILNSKYKIVSRRKEKTRSEKGPKKTEDRVVRALNRALEEAELEAGDLRGIGAGSPGPLDPDTGTIIDTPNIAWKDFPLASHLTKAFGVPCVIDNDVNLGTYGEWHFGEVSDSNNVLGVFPGTGIGGGWVLDGEIFHGLTGSAFEIGHMTIEVDGPFCGCGKRGCLEALASRIAIAKEVAALAARNDAPYILENCGTDIANIRSGAIARAIKAGDTHVEEVVRRAAYYVGVGVGNLINVLSPEAIVLGGGLVEAMGNLYLKEVKRGIEYHAMPFLRKDVRITTAKLGDDAVIMGAAKLIEAHLSHR